MKAWYMSKTLWIAFIVFVVSALRAAGVDVPIVTEDGATMNMILSVVFFILRMITGKELTGTK